MNFINNKYIIIIFCCITISVLISFTNTVKGDCAWESIKYGADYDDYVGDVRTDNSIYSNGVVLSSGEIAGSTQYNFNFPSVFIPNDIDINIFYSDNSIVGNGPQIRIWNWTINDWDTTNDLGNGFDILESFYTTAVDHYISEYGQISVEIAAQGWDATDLSWVKIYINYDPPITEIPILMYHKIGDYAHTDYWMTDERFESHINALTAHGYSTINLIDIYNYVYEEGSLPNKPVVITVDDAYLNFLTHALPVLQEYNIKATLFVPTDYISDLEENRQDNFWETDPNEAQYITDMLIWSEIITIDESGFVEIGSHSKSHPRLADLTDSEVIEELQGSKTILEQKLGHAIEIFSYPFGSGQTDDRIIQLVENAGYKCAVAAWNYDGKGLFANTSQNIYSLKRFNVNKGFSVNYNNNNPDDFFWKYIEPDYQIPIITMDSIQFLDPITNIEKSSFERGENVKIKIIATNNGDTQNVRVSLHLDDDDNVQTPSIYTSHPNNDLIVNFQNGEQKTLIFNWQIPEYVPTGQYFYNATFNDDTNSVGFKFSSWINAFTINQGQNPPIDDLIITVYCPINIHLTDPLGRYIHNTYSNIPNSVYNEYDFNNDGEIDDQIIVEEALDGEYYLSIIPENNADPTETFSIIVNSHGEEIVYVENEQISNIPDDPYEIIHGDTLPPITNIDFDSIYYTDGIEEWITCSTSVILTAEDLGDHSSGVKAINYSYGYGWNIEYSDSVIFNIPIECEHTIEWYAIDNENNTSPLTYHITPIFTGRKLSYLKYILDFPQDFK